MLGTTLKIEAKTAYSPHHHHHPQRKQILELSNADCKMQISVFLKTQGILENRRMGHLKMVDQI